MPYPCENDPGQAKPHEMLKGAGKGQLKPDVDCAIDARDQWMKDLTVWLKALGDAVNECRAACGLPPFAPPPQSPDQTETTLRALGENDPPKPPKDWP